MLFAFPTPKCAQSPTHSHHWNWRCETQSLQTKGQSWKTCWFMDLSRGWWVSQQCATYENTACFKSWVKGAQGFQLPTRFMGRVSPRSPPSREAQQQPAVRKKPLPLSTCLAAVWRKVRQRRERRDRAPRSAITFHKWIFAGFRNPGEPLKKKEIRKKKKIPPAPSWKQAKVGKKVQSPQMWRNIWGRGLL